MSTIRVTVEVPELSTRQRMFLSNECAFPDLTPPERRRLVQQGLIWIYDGAMDLTPLARALLEREQRDAEVRRIAHARPSGHSGGRFP